MNDTLCQRATATMRLAVNFHFDLLDRNKQQSIRPKREANGHLLEHRHWHIRRLRLYSSVVASSADANADADAAISRAEEAPSTDEHRSHRGGHRSYIICLMLSSSNTSLLEPFWRPLCFPGTVAFQVDSRPPKLCGICWRSWRSTVLPDSLCVEATAEIMSLSKDTDLGGWKRSSNPY